MVLLMGSLAKFILMENSGGYILGIFLKMLGCLTWMTIIQNTWFYVQNSIITVI